MAVDPWGRVLGELAGTPGVLRVSLPRAALAEARALLPAAAGT